MKAAIPVGKVAHKTYKGRLVAPGFAKRNVKRRSWGKNGRAGVIIGVAAEAFYAVQFVDRGTKKMTARNWFKKRFILGTPEMEKNLVIQLQAKIAKAIK